MNHSSPARTALTAICLSLLTATPLFAEGIPWIEDLSAGWSQSRSSGRPMLIYCTSSGCHYCKLMEERTLASFPVVAQITRDAIPIRLRASKDLELMRQIGVNAFPTTLLATPDGRVVDHHVGFADVEKLKEMLHSALGRPIQAAHIAERIRAASGNE